MTTVRLERTFDASAEAVFDAWTHPEVLRRRWATGEDWTTPEAEMDLRVGGGYRLTMRDPGGAACTVVGEYLEISRPGRLRYTRRWAGGEEATASSTCASWSAGAGPRCCSSTPGCRPPRSREEHERGWSACLATLARRVLPARAEEAA
jgi:uncharacterized protein YndB with AHSA1/START domain